MKIEIDLNDILGDEYGAETLQDSVRRQVIEQMTKAINEGVGNQIKSELARVFNEEIRAAVTSQMPTIVNDLLNAEYTPVDRYGDRSGPTTFRKELVAAIHEQMKYKKSQYSSKRNAFTSAVDAVIADNVKEFKADFNKLVNEQFIAEAMAHATIKLAERLGVKA